MQAHQQRWLDWFPAAVRATRFAFDYPYPLVCFGDEFHGAAIFVPPSRPANA